VKLSLDWEITVTKQINELVDLAGKENDHTSHTFLQWFVNEQLEEVSSMDMLLKMVKRRERIYCSSRTTWPGRARERRQARTPPSRRARPSEHPAGRRTLPREGADPSQDRPLFLFTPRCFEAAPVVVPQRS